MSANFANSERAARENQQLEPDKSCGENSRQMAQNHHYLVRNEKEKRQWYETRRLRRPGRENFVPDERTNDNTDRQ